ncbi:hypothetical protein GCM10009737_10220 [Nocardioides lentus]|uniref:Aminoglycoside phosphotransferase domain-containing protein n=1 Tax=Nocardioides lentus TaxID=338077 RepID=A0ABP5AEW9_9ACTN
MGPADVDDAALAVMVADLLGRPPGRVELLTARAEPLAHDVPSLTTVGRWWVSGTARTPAGEEPWRVFVKQVQAWHHSAFFAGVPEPLRKVAAAAVPWRPEAGAYRSDLRDRLPEGLTLPRALAVLDLDPGLCPDSWVLWLEDVTRPAVPWDVTRHEGAAHLLGRMSGSAAVAPLADVGRFDWSARHYVEGRLRLQVLPALSSEDLWAHPAVAAAFDAGLRRRLLAAADRVDALAAELDAHPRRAAHGDACAHNLLPGPDGVSFTMVDLGFWVPQAAGFDLTQLLAGDLQLGVVPPADLATLDEVCVRAYADGLAAEGSPVPLAVVRRVHALALLLYAGLSAVPSEQLAAPAEVLGPLCALRADLARHSLDLLDATA